MAKNSGSNKRHEGYVPAVYARDWSQAEFLRSLLAEHDVAAVLPETHDDGDAAEVPILVPEECLEEAQEILEDYTGQDEAEDLDEDDYDDYDEGELEVAAEDGYEAGGLDDDKDKDEDDEEF